MTHEQMEEVDLDFLRRVYEHCGRSLDAEVRGTEIAEEIGLDPQETATVVARLVRTGFLRDVGGNFRVKITVRTIGLLSARQE